MMEYVLEHPVIAGLAMAAFALVIRIAVPAMLRAEKDWLRAVLGTAVFVSYTVIMLLTVGYFARNAVTVEECLRSACVGIVVGNVMMLFAAAIFFFTREKRSMSQEERMKLKDL